MTQGTETNRQKMDTGSKKDTPRQMVEPQATVRQGTGKINYVNASVKRFDTVRW